jgi:uncharacterized protein YggE
MLSPHRLALAASAALGSIIFAGSTAPAANPAASPPLTVEGFGLATLPTGGFGPPQLNLNFRVSGANANDALTTLQKDVSAVQASLTQAGIPAAAVAPQPPILNFIASTSLQNCQEAQKLKGVPISCPTPGFQASENLQVTFSTLTQLANFLTTTPVAQSSGVQNIWINSEGQGQTRPDDGALSAAYRQALADAQHTAQLLAAAQGLQLGPPIAVRQGTVGGGCPGPGCGPFLSGMAPPTAGPNQALVAVTVTYSTRPSGTP